MTRTWLMVLLFETASTPGAAAATQHVRKAIAKLEISGDVDAMLTDSRGRRTGWEGHRVEEIPGCALEAEADEIAEPTAYVLRWKGAVSGTFRLLLKARTSGNVQIMVSAIAAHGARCTKESSDTLAARASAEWAVHLVTGTTECKAELTRQKPPQ